MTSEGDLVLYGNLLMNHPDKLEMLRTTLPAWIEYWARPAFLRFRGPLSDEAQDFASALPQVTTALGSKFRTWRAQALADVRSLDSHFVFVFLEDHIPAPNPVPAISILRDLAAGNVDVLQYSWFASYERQRSLLQGAQGKLMGSTIQIDLDASLARHLAPKNPMYFVSLTSVFNRNFLMRLLRSGRPWIRRFDPQAPFDVEQQPGSTWLLPIRYACPTSELGICLDDDLTTPGSSAMSRGLYPRRSEQRVFTHHSSTSFRHLLGRQIAALEHRQGGGAAGLSALLFARKALTALDMLRYSLRAPMLKAIDRRIADQSLFTKFG